jgi:hypothetical protein
MIYTELAANLNFRYPLSSEPRSCTKTRHTLRNRQSSVEFKLGCNEGIGTGRL